MKASRYSEPQVLSMLRQAGRMAGRSGCRMCSAISIVKAWGLRWIFLRRRNA
jgi:hypothetical protein